MQAVQTRTIDGEPCVVWKSERGNQVCALVEQLDFAASADAVLPYMRSYEYVDISREHEDPPREWCVVVAVTRESRIYIGQSPSFARAACIALILAKRAEKK